MNKRGLSEIVVSILIILLVLGAIIIVWAVVGPLITNTSGQITTGTITTKMKVLSVSGNNVIVSRGVGEGNLVAIKFVLTNTDGTKVVVEKTTTLTELDSAAFTFTNLELANVKSIEVAPVIQTQAGQRVIGQVQGNYVIPSSGTPVVPKSCSGPACSTLNTLTTCTAAGCTIGCKDNAAYPGGLDNWCSQKIISTCIAPFCSWNTQGYCQLLKTCSQLTGADCQTMITNGVCLFDSIKCSGTSTCVGRTELACTSPCTWS